ncbi:MAG: hypothetical protein AB7F86_02600 [Bdellovibrionales bacterium]
MSEEKKVLYIVVRRPDAKYNHKWQGARMLELHTDQKAVNLIEKYRADRLFVKISTKREIICSVVVEDIQKNEDGTVVVKFNDIRTDHWVIPGEVKGNTRGYVEGPPPIPVPTNYP